MRKNKRGLSVIIGYVLLVVFAVIISAIVFQWLKTYIPAQSLECPGGVSLFINDASFNSNNKKFEITITNNGRFNVSGYFIYIKNDTAQEIAIINISNYLNMTDSGEAKNDVYPQVVLFSFLGGEFKNFFSPGEKITHYFDFSASTGQPISVKITSLRFQEYNERQRAVICGNSFSERDVKIKGDTPPDEDPDDDHNQDDDYEGEDA